MWVADSSTRVFTLPAIEGLSSTYFVNLTLESSGNLVSRNFYWLSTKPEEVDFARVTPESRCSFPNHRHLHPHQDVRRLYSPEHAAAGRSGCNGAVEGRGVRGLHYCYPPESELDARLRSAVEGEKSTDGAYGPSE